VVAVSVQAVTHPLLERTESRIQAEIVEYLQVAGWYVRVFSQDKPYRQQITGWIDVWATRRNVALHVQVKTTLGRLTPAQREFAEYIKPHLGPNVRYIEARDLSDVARELGDSVI
jgi:site-specific recombinase